MQKALIFEATGEVKNVIEISDDPNASPYVPRPEYILVDFSPGVTKGGTWDGTNFQPPPSPTPKPPSVDPQIELDAAIEGLRVKALAITDPETLDFANSLIDALLGVGRAGKVSGRPL